MWQRKNWADRIRDQKLNTDQRPPDNIRPDGAGVMRPTEPVPEGQYATVYPYRGIEQHGVDTKHAEMLPAFDYPDEAPEHWEAPAPDIEPVPVRVISQSTDEYRAFRTMQFPVRQSVNQLLGRDRTRRRASLFNMGPGVCLIGPGPDVSIQTGWPIYYGASAFVVESTEPIYVLSYDAQAVTLAVFQEYMVNPLDQNVGNRHTPHRP